MCKLLDNSSDLSDYDEEIELLVEEGQAPVFLHRQKSQECHHHHQLQHDKTTFVPDDEEEDSLSSQRDSFPLGAGCLPCTPKSIKKTPIKHFCKHHGKNSSNWCCGVVANTVKKTTKKL